MGGNALTEVDTVRLDKLDYEYVTHLIVNKVKLAYPDVTIQPTASYRNKPDFGDADIVLHWDNQKSLVEVVQELFSPTQIVKNGNVISFDYDNFQIDFIYFTDLEVFKFAWCYFSGLCLQLSKWYRNILPPFPTKPQCGQVFCMYCI